MCTRGLLMGICLLFSWSALAVMPTNVGPFGTATGGGSLTDSSVIWNLSPAINGSIAGQADFYNWLELVWASPRRVGLLVVDQCPGYVVGGYEIQIRTEANPTWTTIGGPYTGLPSGSRPSNSYNLSAYGAITGVRFQVNDSSNIADSKARVREIWAFEDYSTSIDLTPLATFSANWSSHGGMTDRDAILKDKSMVSSQIFTASASNPCIYAEFQTAVAIGSFWVAGGSGGENLRGVKLQYSLDADPANLLAYVDAPGGSSSEVAFAVGCELTKPIEAKYWRFVFPHSAGYDGNVRVSEIMLFAPIVIPEPATMTLLALGSLALLRRRK